MRISGKSPGTDDGMSRNANAVVRQTIIKVGMKGGENMTYTPENKILNDLFELGVLEELAENLKLRKVPVIRFTNNRRIRPMRNDGYSIIINNGELLKHQRWYDETCGTAHAAFDATLSMIAHECYHIHEYESGDDYSDIKADSYMLSMCFSEKSRWLALYMMSARDGSPNRYLKKRMINAYKLHIKILMKKEKKHH